MPAAALSSTTQNGGRARERGSAEQRRAAPSPHPPPAAPLPSAPAGRRQPQHRLQGRSSRCDGQPACRRPGRGSLSPLSPLHSPEDARTPLDAPQQEILPKKLLLACNRPAGSQPTQPRRASRRPGRASPAIATPRSSAWAGQPPAHARTCRGTRQPHMRGRAVPACSSRGRRPEGRWCARAVGWAVARAPCLAPSGRWAGGACARRSPLTAVWPSPRARRGAAGVPCSVRVGQGVRLRGSEGAVVSCGTRNDSPRSPRLCSCGKPAAGRAQGPRTAPAFVNVPLWDRLRGRCGGGAR